jgi:hypothetical protein
MRGTLKVELVNFEIIPCSEWCADKKKSKHKLTINFEFYDEYIFDGEDRKHVSLLNAWNPNMWSKLALHAASEWHYHWGYATVFNTKLKIENYVIEFYVEE